MESQIYFPVFENGLGYAADTPCDINFSTLDKLSLQSAPRSHYLVEPSSVDSRQIHDRFAFDHAPGSHYLLEPSSQAHSDFYPAQPLLDQHPQLPRPGSFETEAASPYEYTSSTMQQHQRCDTLWSGVNGVQSTLYEPGPLEYAQPGCKTTFMGPAHVKTHEKEQALDKETYPCPVCDTPWSGENEGGSSLSEIEPLECTHPGCKMRYKRLQNLKKHMNKHALVKELYPCPVCNTPWSGVDTPWSEVNGGQSSLIDVSRKKCPHPGCEQRYTRDVHLNRHMKKHALVKEKYQCPLCDRIFWHRRDNFRTHFQKQHIDKTPYPKERERRKRLFNSLVDNYQRKVYHRH